MKELVNTTSIVKELLERDEQCRNSDSFLYLKVIKDISSKYGFYIPLDQMTVENFLRRQHELPVPSFETVRRTRQKVQASCPELRGCDKVEHFREEKEKVYRRYAKGVIV